MNNQNGSAAEGDSKARLAGGDRTNPTFERGLARERAGGELGEGEEGRQRLKNSAAEGSDGAIPVRTFSKGH